MIKQRKVGFKQLSN